MEVRGHGHSRPACGSAPWQAKIGPKRSVASTTYFSCVSSSFQKKAWCGDFGGHYFVAWRRGRKWIIPPSPGGILELDSSISFTLDGGLFGCGHQILTKSSGLNSKPSQGDQISNQVKWSKSQTKSSGNPKA
ncbi:unnamed protein product [Prunus armeniaca]